MKLQQFTIPVVVLALFSSQITIARGGGGHGGGHGGHHGGHGGGGRYAHHTGGGHRSSGGGRYAHHGTGTHTASHHAGTRHAAAAHHGGHHGGRGWHHAGWHSGWGHGWGWGLGALGLGLGLGWWGSGWWGPFGWWWGVPWSSNWYYPYQSVQEVVYTTGVAAQAGYLVECTTDEDCLTNPRLDDSWYCNTKINLCVPDEGESQETSAANMETVDA